MAQIRPERAALLLLVATLLFLGALRSFFAAVYYQNLATLGLNATAAYAAMLLAGAAFLVPALRRNPAQVLLAAAVALAFGRLLLPATRGTPLHLPLAGLAVAGWILLVGALAPQLRSHAAPGAGLALGFALDVALLFVGDSSDPTAGWRGLFLLAPAALLLLGLARDAARHAGEPTRAPGAPWIAGLALGAWLFLEHTLLANPYGAARWNGGDPPVYAAASVIGLLAGALTLARGHEPTRRQLLALHVPVVFALVDHALVHSPLLPLWIVGAQAALALDAAILLRLLADPRALLLAGLVTLLLHFSYAFTFLFSFVPFSGLWKDRAPTLYLLAGLVLLLVLLRWPGLDAANRETRRSLRTLAAVPALVAVAALALGATPVPEASGPEIRVLTYNLHQGFANDGALDPDLYLRILQDENADLVILQESDTPRFTSGNLDLATYLADRAGYHLAYGQPTREQAFGGAILSRHPIEEWQALRLPSSSSHRWYTEARLDVDGRALWVYALHLALPRDDRLAQIDVILERASTRAGPRILAGDLNSCPTGLCPDEDTGLPDDVYERATRDHVDAWTAGGRTPDDPAGHTYDATEPYERIDYILVTPDLTILEADRIHNAHTTRASDHLPVRAVLRIG